LLKIRIGNLVKRCWL